MLAGFDAVRTGLGNTAETGHLPMINCHAGVYNIMHTCTHTFPRGTLNAPYKEINNSRFRIIRTYDDVRAAHVYP